MLLADWFPPWLLAALCYTLAALSLVRARRDRRRGAGWALVPIVTWLGTVYLATEFGWWGMDDPNLRAYAIRPVLAALLIVHIVAMLAALRQVPRV